MSRERHYNKGWSSSSTRKRSRSPYWRRHSRSPIRDKYSNRSRFRNDRRDDARNEHQRREDIRSEQEEAMRREMKIREEQIEIQLREDARQRELKRREEELEIQMRVEEREKEIKRIEEQIEQQMREEEIKKKEMKRREEDEKKKKELEEQKNAGVAEDDLRFMLEKSRTFQGLTPPVAPPSNTATPTENTMTSNIKIASTSGTENIPKIPGFDYSRLGSEPSNDAEKITRSVNSTVDENSDKSREGRVKYFTKDCDTVAHVTQLLIDQDPTLEEALVKAMRGVLQKVMQKHLEVIQM